jgi:hypothetical protein
MRVTIPIMPNLLGNASRTGLIMTSRTTNNAIRNITLFLRFPSIISPHFCLYWLGLSTPQIVVVSSRIRAVPARGASPVRLPPLP